MKRCVLALLTALTLSVAVTFPAAGITYGEPDDGEHPYVGFMIYWVPAEESWFSCTGTLLDEDTFLTAGHCTDGIGIDGEQPVGPGGEPVNTGGTDVWVTFDDTRALEGFPPRTSFDTPEELYEGRRAWLDAHPDFVTATAYTHPEYDGFSRFPQNFDVGVVELDEGVTLARYGELAPLGAAERIYEQARNPNDALVETVGYGIQSVQPHPMDEESRYKSTSRIVEVNGNIADGGNLHTLNNPSKVGGRGGSCFGDSGGPVFVNDTNQVLAVVSFGFSATCHGADYSWRVDTVDSYNFILPFLQE